MASEVSICNLALTRVGEAGSITSIKPPEGSVHAKVCAVLYPVSVGILLEAHDWRFATRRAALTEIQTKELHGWRGLFALPSDCQRVISVRPSAIRRAPWPQNPLFVVERFDGSPALYTDCPTPVVQYIMAEPGVGSFPPLFVDALAWHLAQALAGALIKGKEGIQVTAAITTKYEKALAEAMKKDAGQHYEPICHVAPWIAVR